MTIPKLDELLRYSNVLGESRIKRVPIAPERFYADLTDPKNHDLGNFCYIIHAINPYSALLFGGSTAQKLEFDPAQNIDLLRNPHLISEKKKISASIVSEEYMGMFGKIFFILDVPWGNILDMAHEDKAIATGTLEEHLANQQLPYMSPREFVRATRDRAIKSNWNEILITGRRSENAVRSIGVGITYDRAADGTIYAPTGADEIKQISSSLELPLIKFYKDLAPLAEGPAEFCRNVGGNNEVHLICINYGNRRYSFDGSWDETKFERASKSDLGIVSRGHNPVTKDEYLQLRQRIVDGINMDTDREFVAQIDAHYKVDEISPNGLM